MKKNVIKKLGLSRETLRVLDELDKVAAGTSTDITQSWPGWCDNSGTCNSCGCNSGDFAC